MTDPEWEALDEIVQRTPEKLLPGPTPTQQRRPINDVHSPGHYFTYHDVSNTSSTHQHNSPRMKTTGDALRCRNVMGSNSAEQQPHAAQSIVVPNAANPEQVGRSSPVIGSASIVLGTRPQQKQPEDKKCGWREHHQHQQPSQQSTVLSMAASKMQQHEQQL
eukprot:PhM_4_TR18624/c0_g5_i1/m.27229